MPGRLFFAAAMIVFGIQHFLYVRFLATLVPHYLPGHHLWVIGTGLALIAAGLSIATTIEDKYAAYGLFALFFGWLVLLHAPRIFHALHNGDEWSSGFVVLAFSGTSLLLAAASSGTSGKSKGIRPQKRTPLAPLKIMQTPTLEGPRRPPRTPHPRASPRSRSHSLRPQAIWRYMLAIVRTPQDLRAWAESALAVRRSMLTWVTIKKSPQPHSTTS